MTIHCQRCESDDDYAKVSLFLLAHKHDLHPAISTLEMVSLIYSYVTQGHLVKVTDADNQVIGAAAYYFGTPDQEFLNQEVALLDVAIFDQARRGTRAFLQGLQYLVREIVDGNPAVKEIQLAAQADNHYLCRLYGKFARASFTREGSHGQEIVFSEKIVEIQLFLNRFNTV